MSHYALPALVALTVNVSLIVIVLLDNYRSHPHRLFALLIASFALWNVGDILVVQSASADQARIGADIVVTALLFATALFLNISFVFPREISSAFTRRSVRFGSYGFALVFSVLSASGITHPLDVRFYEKGPPFFYALARNDTLSGGMLFLLLLATLAIGARHLVLQLRDARSRKERLQIRFLLIGTIVYALLIAALDFLRDEEIAHVIASRGLFILLSVFFAYVTLANRLLIVHNILTRGIVYFFVTGAIFSFYVLVVLGFARSILNVVGSDEVLPEVLVIFALSLMLWPLAHAVQSLLSRLFYQHVFHMRDKFIQFTRDAFKLTTVVELAGAVDSFLKRGLRASVTDLLVYDERGLCLRSARLTDATIPVDGRVLSTVSEAGQPIEVREILDECSTTERVLLQQYDGGILVSLRATDGMDGLLLVGPSVDRRPYSLDEVQFLAVFANEVSMAGERNRMLQLRNEEEVKRAQTEKLAALGRLTAGIAHEFRNPLSIIKTSAQTILRRAEDLSVVRETGQFIVSETDRLDSIVRTFLQFAKPHTPLWERCDLGEIFDGVAGSLERTAAAAGVRIQIVVSSDVRDVVTSRRHVEQSLINLGMNAIEAMRTGGTLTFSATMKDPTGVLIAVTDTGPGIPDELKSRMFDPFVTTKSAGTGLGLSIVYTMVQALKGSIDVSTSSAGTTFTIELSIQGAV